MGGGPGVRVHQMGGGAPRRRPHNHANQPPASPLAALQSLLPLLLLFIIPLLSSLFSGGAPTYPSVHFDNPLPPQTQHRVTRNFKVDYYVNPAEVKDYNNWKNLDYHVEEQYKDILVGRCNIEVDKRRRAFQAAQGFWTTDEEKLAEAKRLVQPSCKRLERMGYRIQY
jgi:DnaJ family protein B protein 12